MVVAALRGAAGSAGVAALSLAGLTAGCTCGARPSPGPAEGAPSARPSAAPSTEAAPAAGSASSAAAAPDAAATSGSPDAPAQFSAPIGAARLASGAIWGAGLVVERKVIALARLRSDGGPAEVSDVMQGVSWVASAELQILPMAEGAAIVWRGAREGKSSRWLVSVNAAGVPQGEVIEIGAAPCATARTVAWLERRGEEPVRVRGRVWGESPIRELAVVPKGREASLACGDSTVFVFGDGDRDVTLLQVAPLATDADHAKAPVPVTLLDAKDFSEDDKRAHEAFTVGDELVVVHVAQAAVSVREVRGATVTPWRTLKHRLGPDDDVVAVDGDAETMVVAFTRDEAATCRGDDEAVSVHALRVERKTGHDALVRLAPAKCGEHVGPFWIGMRKGAPLVAWADRLRRRDATTPPIAGVGLRAPEADAGAPSHVVQAADALAEAGCDARACYVVALLREPGTDGMTPARLRLVRVP